MKKKIKNITLLILIGLIAITIFKFYDFGLFYGKKYYQADGVVLSMKNKDINGEKYVDVEDLDTIMALIGYEKNCLCLNSFNDSMNKEEIKELNYNLRSYDKEKLSLSDGVILPGDSYEDVDARRQKALTDDINVKFDFNLNDGSLVYKDNHLYVKKDVFNDDFVNLKSHELDLKDSIFHHLGIEI